MTEQVIAAGQVTADRPHGVSLAVRLAIVTVVVTCAGVLDYLVQFQWLPSLMSHVGVEQLRPDDMAAQALWAATQLANWSHPALVGLAAAVSLALLLPPLVASR